MKLDEISKERLWIKELIVVQEGGQRSAQEKQGQGGVGQTKKWPRGGSKQMIRIQGPYWMLGQPGETGLTSR